MNSTDLLIWSVQCLREKGVISTGELEGTFCCDYTALSQDPATVISALLFCVILLFPPPLRPVPMSTMGLSCRKCKSNN